MNKKLTGRVIDTTSVDFEPQKNAQISQIYPAWSLTISQNYPDQVWEISWH